MRLRFAVLVSVLTAMVAVAAPGVVSAAPHHNHGLTINATPNPITAGDPVLIYGQLNTSHPGSQWVYLYHRVNPAPTFTLIGRTKTDSVGFYKFTREEGIVLTNRNWFVRAPFLPGNIHSRTVHERVMAALTLSASSPTGVTNHPVVFTGHITPAVVHVGERVYLQSQEGTSGDDWRTIRSGVINGGSNYSIPYRFAVPGEKDLRVVFRGDNRNIAGHSDSVAVTIQQAQNPTFTINTSAPIINDGQSATISGVLHPPAGMGTIPATGINVTLWGRQDGQKFAPLQHTNTKTDGSYTFSVSPQHNTEYFVQTTFKPFKHTARLFEGVRDVVTIAASSTTSMVGGKVTFTGTVTPDKARHVIELQRLGKDGDYHTVAVGRVNSSSAYRFVWKFGSQGTHTFRTLVPGGPENVSGHSPAVTVIVSLPSILSLPPAS
jgi:hypothetical protein